MTKISQSIIDEVRAVSEENARRETLMIPDQERESVDKRISNLEAKLSSMESENKAQAMENRSLRERVEILLQSVKALEKDQSEMSQDLQKADWELRERVEDLELVAKFSMGVAIIIAQGDIPELDTIIKSGS